MDRRSVPFAGALVALVLLASMSASASPESEGLRARAASALYSLDCDLALTTYRDAIKADAGDAMAYRGLATALWVSIALRQGTLTVDSYFGRVSQDNVNRPPPPKEIATEFHQAIEHATAIARRQLGAKKNDPEALFQLGAALGLRAGYEATVDGRVRTALWSAREAYDAHEKVLELDPQRHQAGLTVGTYRYVVARLSLPLRWAAYAAGFGGGREQGLRLVEAAAAHPGDHEADARVALVLLYNRERRYVDALGQLATLRAQYPRNRLLWLESGSTAVRAGRHAEADRFLTDGIARLASDTRPRMFGEEAMWYYKRGTARAALGRGDAEQDLRRALALEGRPWVRGRAHLELGKLARKTGNREAADASFRQAIKLAESDNDPAVATEARRLMLAR